MVASLKILTERNRSEIEFSITHLQKHIKYDSFKFCWKFYLFFVINVLGMIKKYSHQICFIYFPMKIHTYISFIRKKKPSNTILTWPTMANGMSHTTTTHKQPPKYIYICHSIFTTNQIPKAQKRAKINKKPKKRNFVQQTSVKNEF